MSGFPITVSEELLSYRVSLDWKIMIEGARTCHGNRSVYAVKNLHFNKPIKVYPQRPVEVEVHMSSEEGLLVDCELQSIRTLAKDRILEVQILIVLFFDENEYVDILPVVESGLMENTNVTQSDIYRYFFHGPRFQVLDEIVHLSPHHLHGYMSVDTFMRSMTDPLVLEVVFQKLQVFIIWFLSKKTSSLLQ